MGLGKGWGRGGVGWGGGLGKGWGWGRGRGWGEQSKQRAVDAPGQRSAREPCGALLHLAQQ